MDICPPNHHQQAVWLSNIANCWNYSSLKYPLNCASYWILQCSVNIFFDENNTFRAELRGEESNIHRAEGGGAVHCQGYHHRQWQNIVPGTGPGHIT